MLGSGCVEKKVKPSTSKKYLVYNLGGLPENLMMLSSNNVTEKDLLLALFEGLVREDKNGQIVPAMAETFRITEDGIGYTFKLRKDIHYSDGRVIKAIDFERFFYDIPSLLSIIIITLYNGTRGNKMIWLKHAFYFVYPVHHVIIYYIAMRMFG